MTRTSPRSLSALGLAALAAAALLAQEARPAPRAVERALALFDGEEGGSLALEAALVIDDEAHEQATVEILVAGSAAAADLEAWVVVPRLDDEPWVRAFDPPPPVGAPERRLLRAALTLPDGFLDAAVVVEQADGRWGAALVELTDEPLAVGPEVPVWEAPAEPAAAEAQERARAVVIRLLPPRDPQVKGRVRLRTLVSDPLVLKTTFLLDGQEVAEDDDPPFTAQVDLGPRPLPRRITVVAYGPKGARLGEDSIRVNAGEGLFTVRIARLVGDPGAGPVEAEARVTVPSDGDLESVGFYLNQELVALVRQPPFVARIEIDEPAPADFVRVAARLTDGREAEDARLLAAPAERVEVNLVEIYAVVTDGDGKPVPGLGAEDLEVKLGGRRVALERFGPADRVPLVLGLIIDTSGSMEPLMIDTKQAGSKFLASVLRRELGDRAFLVDFDTRPRLAHATSSEVGDLLRSFGRLRADGYTALYDAIIFSLLQFEGSAGRRALVLLSDGDDYRSRFSQGRAIRYARELGVPVYILALGGILDARLGLRKTDLEGITESTGGRIFYIGSATELDGAYETIQSELRNQYLLAFSTDRELGRRELDSIRVAARRPGLAVRSVVGGRSID